MYSITLWKHGSHFPVVRRDFSPAAFKQPLKTLLTCHAVFAVVVWGVRGDFLSRKYSTNLFARKTLSGCRRIISAHAQTVSRTIH